MLYNSQSQMGDFIKIPYMVKCCENSLYHFNRADTNLPPTCVLNFSIAIYCYILIYEVCM